MIVVIFTLFLNENGEVYCIGSGEYGKIGLVGRNTDEIKKIHNLPEIQSIACGLGDTDNRNTQKKSFQLEQNQQSHMDLVTSL